MPSWDRLAFRMNPDRVVVCLLVNYSVSQSVSKTYITYDAEIKLKILFIEMFVSVQKRTALCLAQTAPVHNIQHTP
jgi:hypothetical protein